jgi:hypothetical protein
MLAFRMKGDDLPTCVDPGVCASGWRERWLPACKPDDRSLQLTSNRTLVRLWRKPMKARTVVLDIQADHSVHSCPLPAPMRLPHAFSLEHQLHLGHHGAIATPRSEMKETDVTALPSLETRRQLLYELVGNAHIIELRDDLSPRVQIAPLSQGDELLGHRAQRLRFGLGGLDLLVSEQVRCLVAQ